MVRVFILGDERDRAASRCHGQWGPATLSGGPPAHIRPNPDKSLSKE
jgi:hypothetical protein